MDPAVRSAAGAFCVVDSTDIACAETDERTRVLSERCEYQLTDLTRLQNLTGVDVNGFNQNMVLGDVKSVLSLAHCGAGSENVRQAVEIVNLRSPNIFDSLSGGVDRAAELAGNDDFFDVQILFGINAAPESFFAELPRVRRRGPDNGWLIGFQDEQESFAGQRAAPNAKCSEILRADNVGTADVQREVERMNIAVVWTHTDLPEPAAFGVLKFVKVLLGKRAHGGNSG